MTNKFTAAEVRKLVDEVRCNKFWHMRDVIAILEAFAEQLEADEDAAPGLDERAAFESAKKAVANFNYSPLSSQSVEALCEQYEVMRQVGHGFVQAVACAALSQRPDDTELLRECAKWCDSQAKSDWYGKSAGDMVRAFSARLGE